MGHWLAAAVLVAVLAVTAAPAEAQSPYCPEGTKAGYARVQLWRDGNCTGPSVSVGTNDGDQANFAAFRNYEGAVYNVDNSRSSFAVAGGTCVRFYDGPNFTGEESNQLCAQPGAIGYYGLFAFDDRVTSMRVCPINAQQFCTRTGGAAPPAQPTPGPAPGAPSSPGTPTAPGAPGGGSGTPDGTPAGPPDDLRYDPVGRTCARGPQPGALALLAWVAPRYPGRSDGILACRSIRGGRPLSFHAEGRALDWHTSKPTGDRLVADLLANDFELARRIGVQELIWHRKIWTSGRAAQGLRPYSGVDPHTDHVHIALNWPGAFKQTSFWLAQPPPPAQPEPEPRPSPDSIDRASLQYVALGDSYSAGEGADDYQPGTAADENKCLRSRNAYSQVFDPPGVDARIERFFFACSGAVTDDIDRRGFKGEPKQLDHAELNDGTDLVTVGIGGNDAGFADTLKACARGPIRLLTGAVQLNLPDASCTDPIASELIRRAVDDAGPKVERVLRAVKRKTSADTTIVLLGYPHLFPPGYWNAKCASLAPLFGRHQQNFMRDRSEQMRDELAEAADDAGVHFVDMIGPSRTHEICADDGEDWLHACISAKCSEPGSFHPNITGQAGYAAALRSYFERWREEGKPLTPLGLPKNPT